MRTTTVVVVRTPYINLKKVRTRTSIRTSFSELFRALETSHSPPNFYVHYGVSRNLTYEVNLKFQRKIFFFRKFFMDILSAGGEKKARSGCGQQQH